MPKTAVRAAIYCRISIAALNDTTKTSEQERQCREVCRIRGWDVGEVYTDNSRSAWKRDRRRPGWDAMLAAIGDGRLGAIVSYWGDRLVRQPRDLEDLLDLRDGRDIILASVTGHYDFANPDHRMMMRWEVARACNESDTISRRTTAGHERRRREGLVRAGGPGGRAYGFAKDGVTHMPEEAKVIRKMAGRVLNGDGAGVIAASLNAAGLETVTGRAWTHAAVRKMLARPRYAGLMPDGEQHAAWEPVLERETWEMARAMLAHRAAGYAYATNTRRYLLSGIAVCGSCGHPVAVRHSTRSESLRGYGCINKACRRKVHRSVRYTDRFAEGWVRRWLSTPELAAVLAETPQPAVAAEIVTLERRKADAEAALENLAGHPGLDPAVTVRAIASFDEKIAAIRERIAAAPGRRLLKEHRGITREKWERLSLSARRGVVSAACYVTILPGRRGPGFDPESVDIRPRE